jgi:hypothetical protein
MLMDTINIIIHVIMLLNIEKIAVLLTKVS